MGDRVGVELFYNAVKTEIKGQLSSSPSASCSRVGDRTKIDEMW